MSPEILSIIIVINVVLSIIVLLGEYNKKTALLLIAASIILPLTNAVGLQMQSGKHFLPITEIVQLYLALSVLSLLFVSYITITYMRDETQISFFQNKISLNLNVFYMIVIFASALITFFVKKDIGVTDDGLTLKGTFFDCTIGIILLLHVLSLYSLEKTWRYANEYQKRIAGLFFILMLIIITANMFFYLTLYLYHTVNIVLVRINLIVQCITFPITLIGYFRYRLGHEQVTIPRNTVYTSFSLLLCCAIFLGIGVAVYLFHQLQLDLDWFESMALIFATTFLLFLLVSSGNMRIRIIRFVNNKFYINKYDYWDQFFRLHQTYLDSTTLDNAVVNLVENVKYAATASDAFVFLREPHSNNFLLKVNPEYSTAEHLTIPANAALIEVFNTRACEYLNLKKHAGRSQLENKVVESLDNHLVKLSATYAFPIVYKDVLNGLLLISIGTRKLDKEDCSLLKAFTQAIGSAYEKHFEKLKDVENGQFQTFNQVISFVLHDLKNQIATLSLLAKNADVYISNKEFQSSLVRSLGSCTENLTKLTDKLSKSRKGLIFSINEYDILPVLEKVVSSLLLTQNPEIKLEWLRKESCRVMCDIAALEQVFHNLIKNAIEAMDSKGILKVYCGKTGLNIPVLSNYNLPDSQLERFSAVVVFEDSGCGMSKKFIQNKLFRPFETTKDKGIGIGVYQCKTYIEKMNGKLLCHSVADVGASFCILL